MKGALQMVRHANHHTRTPGERPQRHGEHQAGPHTDAQAKPRFGLWREAAARVRALVCWLPRCDQFVLEDALTEREVAEALDEVRKLHEVRCGLSYALWTQ